MASHVSTPRSRSRSSTASSGSSDTTMHDAPPVMPLRARPASHASVSAVAKHAPSDPTFSLLLSLPRELRDKVYTFALVSQFPFWWPSEKTPNHNVALPLLRASRQVYSEAVPILYSQNKFLFTNPSDCTMFRVITPSYSENITSVYFRIREKDVKLWGTYLGSKDPSRSMKYDLPKLKSLWIFLRVGIIGTPGMINGMMGGGLTALFAAQAAAMQHMVGATPQQQQIQQQIQVHMQAIQNIMLQPNFGAHAQLNANTPGNGPAPMPFVQFAQGGFQNQNGAVPHPHGPQNNPPGNPSPLATMAAVAAQQPQVQVQTQALPTPPHPHLHIQHQNVHAHFPADQQHGFFSTLMRWRREMGLDQLCSALEETRPAEADIKIVCIMKLPRPEVLRLVRVYGDELSIDKNGDARTRFRSVRGVDVSLEISGYEVGV